MSTAAGFFSALDKLTEDELPPENLDNIDSLFATDLIVEQQRYEREKAEEERLKRRASLCGTWSRRFDIHTGEPKKMVFKCGLWRDGICPTCLSDRADFIKQSMVNIVATKKVLKAVITIDEAKNIVRKMKKYQYEKFPQEGEEDILFFDEEALPQKWINKIEAEEVTIGDVMKMDWEKVVSSPAKRNKSGTLSTHQDRQPNENFAMVEIEEIITDAPEEVQEDLLSDVMRETADLNPTTPKEAEKAIKERGALYRRKLDNGGYNIFWTTRRVKCQKNRISWSNINDIRKKPHFSEGEREKKRPLAV